MISKENRPSKAGTKSLLQDMITLFLGGRFTILAKPYVVQKNDWWRLGKDQKIVFKIKHEDRNLKSLLF